MSDLEVSLLKPYPADWSVRSALDAYLGENGFSRDEYDASVVKVTFWSITFPLPNPPSRQIAVRLHDLHHVVTGYGTDPVGEAEISAWELRRGIGIFSLFVRAIVVGGVLGWSIAWRNSGAAGYHPDRVLASCYIESYERLQLSVGELQNSTGTVRHTGARQLHYAAPSRTPKNFK